MKMGMLLHSTSTCYLFKMVRVQHPPSGYLLYAQLGIPSNERGADSLFVQYSSK